MPSVLLHSLSVWHHFWMHPNKLNSCVWNFWFSISRTVCVCYSKCMIDWYEWQGLQNIFMATLNHINGHHTKWIIGRSCLSLCLFTFIFCDRFNGSKQQLLLEPETSKIGWNEKRKSNLIMLPGTCRTYMDTIMRVSHMNSHWTVKTFKHCPLSQNIHIDTPLSRPTLG